jgi:hypothetical protein
MDAVARFGPNESGICDMPSNFANSMDVCDGLLQCLLNQEGAIMQSLSSQRTRNRFLFLKCHLQSFSSHVHIIAKEKMKPSAARNLLVALPQAVIHTGKYQKHPAA